jgi:lactate 2-monooxygenase
MHFTKVFSRRSLTWNDLERLRELTSLPIMLKGILSPDDAELAHAHGVDAVCMSNHGGRQIDGEVASLNVLADIVDRSGDMPVLFDSGIRSGADCFKALALGATAVLVGRPVMWGLAVAGQSGVTGVLHRSLAELDLTAGLAGCAGIADVPANYSPGRKHILPHRATRHCRLSISGTVRAMAETIG